MSYGEIQPGCGSTRQRAPEAPWRRPTRADEIERAAAALARELSDLLGWKVKVEVTARLGGQIASSAMPGRSQPTRPAD